VPVLTWTVLYISYFVKFCQYMNSYVSGPSPTTYSHFYPTPPPTVCTLTGWSSRMHPNWLGQPNAPLLVGVAERTLIGQGNNDMLR